MVDTGLCSRQLSQNTNCQANTENYCKEGRFADPIVVQHGPLMKSMFGQGIWPSCAPPEDQAPASDISGKYER
jgi:hypothetical protein